MAMPDGLLFDYEIERSAIRLPPGHATVRIGRLSSFRRIAAVWGPAAAYGKLTDGRAVSVAARHPNRRGRLPGCLYRVFRSWSGELR
jgi:hypothetical protein